MPTCWTNIEDGDIWRLRVDGPNLNSRRIERIRSALDEAIAKGARGVVLDLGRIDHIDPLGLAGLISIARDFIRGPRVVLAGLRPNVQELAMLVLLHDLLDIYDDARAATFDLATPINPA
jgi:anti-anti-sigma regulatory factor